MKTLLLVSAALLSLGTFGLTTAKAGPDDYRDRNDYHRPRNAYRVRADDRDYYPSRRVVGRDYCAPGYYSYPAPYFRPHPRVGFFLPLPPLPIPLPRF